MLRITRAANGEVVFRLSGRMDAQGVAELERLFNAETNGSRIVLDLKDLTLVDQEAVMGPTLQWHLGGGPNGIQHFLDHLMDPLAALMKALGTPDFTPELKKTIAEGVSQMAGGHSVEQLAQEENRLLVDLIKLRAQQAKALAAEAHA
jgi:hypothetical protein